MYEINDIYIKTLCVKNVLPCHRELALGRDDNSTFLLTSVEMSQIIEYLCTI